MATISEAVRPRIKAELPMPSTSAGAGFSVESGKSHKAHPSGLEKNGGPRQIFLMLGFFLYFTLSCVSVHLTQIAALPLYVINRDYYYAWMAVTKQFFGLILNTITQWFSPTVVRISGDESVRGQLKVTKDGRLKCDFPERMIMMANHQIYTDWLYLWWISYTSRMHGHIYIILKESLKYVPIIGPGMIFYGFIFMARNWAKDKPRIQHRLSKLNDRHAGPMSGSQALDPMWLLIFPEGTNLSPNGRKASAKWADKSGLADMRHQLLPRSTGLQFCLQELKKTVDWVYDCTITYEGIPEGEYGQDIFTLRSTYFEGRAPKSVNMYWRRFAVSSIPIDDSQAFEVWLRERWVEKDNLIEQYLKTGRFPSSDNDKDDKAGRDFLETEVQCASSLEFLLVFAPLAVVGVFYYAFRLWTAV